jgi:chaperonin GroEL
MGVQMLRKAAIRTSNEGGDGTATTTVLTQALVSEAFKQIANDSSRIREVRERLESGLVETITALSKLKRDVTEDDIEKIATISSLDPEVAKLIAEVIKEVGINGVVTVEKGAQLGYTKEVVKGARFDRGLISQYFINDKENMQTVLNDAYIVLVDRRVSTNEQIMPIINSIGTGKDILFIADDVDSVALASLAQNALRGVANIACVRNPYTATPAKDFLADIAALTGATVISEEKGMRLDSCTAEVCGRAEKVIVNKDTTTIIGGIGGDALEARIKALQSQIDTTTSPYQKGLLEDRLAALTGGIGVIRVGAYTDSEFNAKKYKFENAVNATQAALQEGILPGGGVALASIAMKHSDNMFRLALHAPFEQMVRNAGMEGKAGVDNVSLDRGIGYDFKTKEKVNMLEKGIIDPAKVVRLACESAVSVTKALVSMETAIVTEDDKIKE